jgi:carboxymethylenebutenolidase
MYTTDQYEGLIAETIPLHGHRGEVINAFFARPLGPGPFPGMVLVHHMPGWDEWYREATLRYAYHGYLALSPNLYFRAGHGAVEDVAARVRGEGGVSDDQAVGDIAGSLAYLKALPYSNGRIGVFGSCSGGRHAFLAACKVKGFAAIVDCWGGRVVMGPDELTPNQPVSPVEFTAGLTCPILGIFGNDDTSPTPAQVDLHEQALIEQGKEYEFHRYAGAGHGFFYQHRPAYRPESAVDGWKKIWAFLEKNLCVR